MYLVELRPGKEELYRTAEELAAAIRSGDVDIHSRIYHRATSKWISVTLHPHYKAIAAERDPSAAPAVPADQRQNWTFFNAASETLRGAEDSHPTKPGEGASEGGEDDHPWRRPIALSVTGMLLILGMQLAFFGPRPPWATPRSVAAAEQPKPVAPAEAPEAPTSSLVSLASTAWSATNDGDWDTAGPEKPAAEPAPKAPAGIPQAPSIRLTTLAQVLPAVAKPAAPVKDDGSTLGGFLRRWSSAHDEAQSRLQSGLRVSRLNQLFSPARLTPNGGVTETRMAIAGAANFIRVYRQQREAIDREFQDSFVVMTRANKLSSSEIRRWYAKVSPREVPALATLTSTILTGMDSLLGVLDAQAGAYRVEKNAIRFEDPSAARAYGALREEIGKAVDVAKAAGGTDSTGPMVYLLEAIGSTRLPKEL
jgi:hypothetical protein